MQSRFATWHDTPNNDIPTSMIYDRTSSSPHPLHPLLMHGSHHRRIISSKQQYQLSDAGGCRTLPHVVHYIPPSGASSGAFCLPSRFGFFISVVWFWLITIGRACAPYDLQFGNSGLFGPTCWSCCYGCTGNNFVVGFLSANRRY